MSYIQMSYFFESCLHYVFNVTDLMYESATGLQLVYSNTVTTLT